MATLNGTIDEAHPPYASQDAGQRRRHRVLLARLPGLERIGKFAIKHREGLQVALRMTARQARHRARVFAEIASGRVANLFRPIQPLHAQTIWILLAPLERTDLSINAETQTVTFTRRNLRSD